MSGTRLNSTQMLKYAFHNMAKNLKDPQIEDIKFGGYAAYDARKITTSDQTYFLLNPATDYDSISPSMGNVGNTPLPDTLAHIKKLKEDPKNANAIFIIPLAECRKRAHWTLLTIQGKHCHFYDPRNKIPYLGTYVEYSLEPVKLYLEIARYSLPDNNIHYTGLQGLLDDTHCGYFVGHIVNAIVGKQATINFISAEGLVAEFNNLPKPNADLLEEKKSLDNAISFDDDDEDEDEIDISDSEKTNISSSSSDKEEKLNSPSISIIASEPLTVTPISENVSSAILIASSEEGSSPDSEINNPAVVSEEEKLNPSQPPTLVSDILASAPIKIVPLRITSESDKNDGLSSITTPLTSEEEEKLRPSQSTISVADVVPSIIENASSGIEIVSSEEDSSSESDSEISNPVSTSIFYDDSDESSSSENDDSSVPLITETTERKMELPELNSTVSQENPELKSDASDQVAIPIIPIIHRAEYKEPQKIPHQEAISLPAHNNLPQVSKTPWWKYALAITGVIVGAAACATGIGALAGIALLGISLGTLAAACTIAGGALAAVNGAVYAGISVYQNNKSHATIPFVRIPSITININSHPSLNIFSSVLPSSSQSSSSFKGPSEFKNSGSSSPKLFKPYIPIVTDPTLKLSDQNAPNLNR